MAGKLHLVATPIGNLQDITLRALDILRQCDIIACEDTRQTRKLLTHFEIAKPLVSYHNFNEKSRTPQLLNELLSGKNIALVSDAGTPGISDPGYCFIRGCIDAGIEVVSIPGPTSIISALLVSGLPMHRFAFEGFMPEKKTARRKTLENLKVEQRTLIFFESARRLQDCLQDLLDIFGNRFMAIARELTKKFETISRGRLDDLMKSLSWDEMKGEIVLVVEGQTEAPQDPFQKVSIPNHVEDVMRQMGLEKKEAIQWVAKARGIPKKQVYDQMLLNKNTNISKDE
jgi:16S rRNA (cytidine1402-2'-O)-methyltransferase